MTVDVVITNLDNTQAKPYEIEPVDARNPEVLDDGSARLARLSFDKSRRR